MSLIQRLAAARSRAALTALFGALLAALTGTAASAATITIVPGTGFNDSTPTSPEGGNTGTTRGQQRLNVFQAAADVWAARLNSNVTIRVAASFASLEPCDTSGGVLGAAGPRTFFSDFTNAPFTATWYPVALANALRGSDLDSTGNDIEAEFNSDIDTGCLGAGSRFWYGTDPSVPVPSNRIALFPVVLHELGHGLGFLTITDEDGSFASGQRDIWTFFLKNFTTNELWKDMTATERRNSGIDDPDLVWDGANVTAALDTIGVTAGTRGTGTSERLRMYAPSPYEPGSSVSHFTTDAAPNLLMEPNLQDDVFVDVDFTIPLFQDIGWSTSGGGGALNQAPTVTAPASISVTEDVASNLTGISIADPDVGTATMDARFQVTAGTLSAQSASGITIAGNNSATLTLSGSRATLNTYITNGNLRYTTPSNDTTSRTLTITVDDNGNTGAGGVMTGTDTVTLTVSAVNDAPTVTAPASYAVTEDTALPIDTVSFADIDAASGSVAATFTITSGTLAGSSISGVTVTATALSRTLTGTATAINSYLTQDRLTYTPANDSTAATTLAISVSDNGNTGSGGARTATANVALNISAVNDAPTITAPASYTVTEDTALPIDTVSFADVDAASGTVSATFTITSGTLVGSSIIGVTVTATALSRTLTGTVAAINAYLSQDRLTYTPASNSTAATTLAVAINDGGNTGSGGARTANANIALNISAVNDAPAINAPATIAVNEDVPASLAPITFTDIDAAGGTVTVTYSITGTGTLAASSVAGVTVTGTQSMRILQGTLAAISSYVAAGNVTFRTAENDATDTTLNVSISDGGNTGSGGAQFANASVALDASAVNDAPVLGAPAQIAVSDATPAPLAGFSVSDVDAEVAAIAVTLTVTDGTIAAPPGVGITVMGADTASVVLTGSAADLQAYLDGANLMFVPDATPDPLVTLTVVADDQGNTGSGGARTAMRTVALDASLLFFDGFE